MTSDPIFGVLAVMSFVASVVAAMMAIDMFALTRTGEFGSAWRVLIIATVVFVLVQALSIASLFSYDAVTRYGLPQIADLMFALSLAYAIYLQRHAYSSRSELRREKKAASEDTSPAEDTDIAAEINDPASFDDTRGNEIQQQMDEADELLATESTLSQPTGNAQRWPRM